MQYERLTLLPDVLPTEEERLEAMREVARDADDLGRVPAPLTLRARALEAHPELSEGDPHFEILYDPITFQVLAAFGGGEGPSTIER